MSGDSPMQTECNEAVDERTENVDAAAAENVTANCDDGSSTKVQSDEIDDAANDLANDENVATVESSVDDKLKIDNNECDVDKSLNITDSAIVKAAATEMNTSIADEAELKRDDGLCNGNIEEKQIPNDGDGDGDNNIEMSTPNGESLTENIDSGDADINFDQIFDNLPENSTTSDSNNATRTEDDVQPIETVPEVPEATPLVAEAHESETKEVEPIEGEKNAAEPEGKNETVVKVSDISLEMSPEAEEELLKSPSMTEQCPNVSTEYSESMLLKDDSKIGATIADEVDTVPAATEEVAETNTATNTTIMIESNELPTSESLFDQLKAAEVAEESIKMASNKLEGDDKHTQEKIESADKSKDALVVEIDNDSNGSDLKESIDSPASNSVQSAHNIDESIGETMDAINNKENNLLEEMAGSPASVGNCMDGGSLSSARDADDNGFADSVIDIKDGNSNDARDGFDNDDKISTSSCHEMMDQTSNSNDHKMDTKYSSNVSRSNESTGFTNEALLDLQDSIESDNLGAKSYDGNEVEDIVDTPDKSSESVIAIDDDDDDAIDSSTPIFTSNEPSDKVDEETKGIEEPPAKRMRIESDEGNDVASNDENQKTEAVECTEKAFDSTANDESSTKEDNVIAVEPKENVTIESEPDKNQATIEEDDDDLVIVESNESEQSSAAADTASNSTNSNKRPASPSPIDTADETRKKHKSNEDGDITTAPVAIVSDVTATVNKLDEQNDTVKTDVVKVDLDAVKNSSEEPTEVKASDVDNLPKSPIVEDDSIVPMEESKPVKNVELKVELKPEPEQCEKRSIALDFATKFKKSLAQMSRKNLEEFVLVKITEAIVHKSEFSELKQKSDAQEQMIQASRVKLQEIGKQYRDLEMVYARLKKDLENKNQIIVSPIKITRAVGLQVSIQKDGTKAPPQKQSVQSNGVVTYSTNASTIRTIMRPDQATASINSAQHQRLASSLASKQITHIQRQPVRPGPATTIRQVVPEQQRLTTTTGMEFGLLASNCILIHLYKFFSQCNDG